jgi:hypothetical protein
MPESSVIFSWGPPRMGTTWLFNVLQEMANRSGTDIKIVADGLPYPEKSWAGNVLVKSHRADSPELIDSFDQQVSLFACVIVRNVEKTLQSLVRTQKADVEELIGWLKADLDAYWAVLPSMRHVVVIAEEWIEDRGTLVVMELAEFLGLKLTPNECADISAEFSKESVQRKINSLQEVNSWSGEFKEYDRQSQWHAGHIATNAPTPLQLNSMQQARVNDLQKLVNELVSNFSLMSAKTKRQQDSAGSLRAMDFIQARQAELTGNSETKLTVMQRVRNILGGARV